MSRFFLKFCNTSVVFLVTELVNPDRNWQIRRLFHRKQGSVRNQNSIPVDISGRHGQEYRSQVMYATGVKYIKRFLALSGNRSASETPALGIAILKPKWFSDFVIRIVKCPLNPPLAPPRRGIGLFSLNFT